MTPLAELERKRVEAMTWRYTVKRYVVEAFEVEIDSDAPPSRKEITDAADDPHTVTVLRETVKRLAGRKE